MVGSLSWVRSVVVLAPRAAVSLQTGRAYWQGSGRLTGASIFSIVPPSLSAFQVKVTDFGGAFESGPKGP